MGNSASTGSELDDEPSSRATSLQPSVGLTGVLRGVGGGHAEGDGARLHELPEAVKFLELAVVCAHRGRRELDAPLWLAYETTDRREGATVAHGRNHPFVEDGPVGETVDAVRAVLQDPRGHIIAATHDDIGAERGDEGVIGLGRVGDDRQPFGLGKLHDIAAIRPGRVPIFQSTGEKRRMPKLKTLVLLQFNFAT
jgi:hypothetical protein